jgi:hypothetical protein
VKTIAFLLFTACSPSAMSTPAAHPANPDAPIGRLAGPPPAVRPGVADDETHAYHVERARKACEDDSEEAREEARRNAAAEEGSR